MSNLDVTLKLYADRCKHLLEESEIRFAGIVNENGDLVYLDSLTNGPSTITEDQARNKIFASLGNRNLVGIVSKPSKKFVIN